MHITQILSEKALRAGSPGQGKKKLRRPTPGCDRP